MTRGSGRERALPCRVEAGGPSAGVSEAERVATMGRESAVASSPVCPRVGRSGITAAGLFLSLVLAGNGPAWAAAEPTAETVAPTAIHAGTLPADSTAAAILHGLRTFSTTGRVLHVGAHPDDENTQLIAYLSRGRGYDTAYLSITRGDGGQNVLGAQLGELLGVARTQELLAARRIDGGRQFFTRAVDFGFSKTPEETLSIWNHREVLGDVVRVIRRFRPDVIVTRFPVPPGSGGHGHHTASAILALEAFKLAGDATAYPEQLKEGLSPWQPKRIVWNGSGFSRGGGIENNPSVKVDIGGSDPVTGEAFATLAGRSRSMHKTQGFGDYRARDAGGPRPETFILLGGEAPAKDFMDGVDTTWARVAGGAEIGRQAAEVIAQFKPDAPTESVPALLELRRTLAALPAGIIVDDKRAQLDRIIEECLGLQVASLAESATVIPGEAMPIVASARGTPGKITVEWVGVDYPGGHLAIDEALAPDRTLLRNLTLSVPKTQAVTQPYWLRLPGAEGMNQVADPALIGQPENPVELPIAYAFRVGGQTLVMTDRPMGGRANAHGARLPLAVISPVAMAFGPGAALFHPGATAMVDVEIKASRSNESGSVRLEVPPGWSVSPPQPFHTGEMFRGVRFTFKVTAPIGEAAGVLRAWAKVDGREWSNDPVTISYPHIPAQLLQPPAEKKVVSVTVETRGHTVGYIAGAGDDVAAALTQLGYQVTELKPGDLTAEKLQVLDAIVVGVRAFNTRKDLVTGAAALFAYAKNGGTVVCQYNRPNGLLTSDVAPYPLTLSDLRTTDENAAVTFLAPAHPVLTVPNKITSADFAGWVQERGTYYPSRWDDHFVPILEMNDPGETPAKGSLLVAPCGHGWFVYTGLAFFRQLPAGVPGAYRLFANLVSLGK